MIVPAERHNGYIADIEYPRHFFRETMPVWMAAILTALGRRAPDLTRPYTWLDLGCGPGLCTVIAAATNPLGRFIGVDFNAGAIEQADTLAQAAGIGNACFLRLGFDQVEEQVPSCDFMVVHGVYSWVSPADRHAIRRIAARKLKPGGVLCLSHLSHPGSSSFDAARKMLRMVAGRQTGSSAGRARAGMAFLRRMAQSGAGYFQDYPDILGSKPVTGDADAAYWAHDYLNEHRDALHIADVIGDFAAVGCEYAGSTAPYENIESASLPGGTLALLDELRRGGADAAELETFKDLARNQTQRCDLYQREHPEGNLLADEAHQHALLAQRVCLLPEAPGKPVPTRGVLTFESRIGPVRLPMEDAAPLLSALQDGARSYAELAVLPSYAHRPGFINTLLQLLAWAGWLQFLRPDHAGGAEDAARRLNAVLAGQAAAFNGAVLAAAAIGSAIPLPKENPADPRRLRWLGIGR